MLDELVDCHTWSYGGLYVSSLLKAYVHRLVVDVGNDGWCVAAPVHDRPDVPKPSLAPIGDVPRLLPGDVARGSEVSLGGFLQDGIV